MRRAYRSVAVGLRAMCATAVMLGAWILFATPSVAATPSPEDWRDVVIYQIMTDRFFDGDPSNNAVEGSFDPGHGARNHGGDFVGIEQKLDYLSQLGVNGVWISPVVVNTNAEYHGFAARDFFAIAPHFGTLAELQSLVQAAHARGIFVVIDIVCNHMGTLIDSGETGYPGFRYPGSYALRWQNPGKRYYGAFDDLSKFHPHGHVQDFNDPEQVLGELFGLDDLKTEDPVVKNQLVLAAEWLMTETDCDGYRIDTVKHVEMDFWNDWAPAVHAHADSLGKSDFFLFGEVFDGNDAKVGSYTGTQSGGNFKLDSVLDFPMYGTTTGVFLYGDPPYDADPGGITFRYSNLGFYDPSSRERLVTFLDNHDVSRFLRAGPSEAIRDESRLRTALGFHLTARGVPVVYYGTEQDFDGGGDPYNREDMWDGQWDFGPSLGDNFDMTHPMFRYVNRLLDVRRRHEALRRGVMTERFAETGGAGLYLFDRTTAGDTVVVAVNTSNQPLERPAEPMPWASGAELVDGLEPAIRDTVSGGAITLRVPARGVRILASLASSASSPDLHVESVFPGHDQSLNDRYFQLTAVFDGNVDLPSLAAGFAITPSIPGEWIAVGEVAHFQPTTAWSPFTEYRWSLEATVRDAEGRTLPARFEAHFRTVNENYGITVPSGHAVDRIATLGPTELNAPEALLPAPWLGPQQLLLADTALDRLFSLTPGGDLGHYLSDARWGKPEGLAHSAAGVTAVIDQSGAFTFDARRMTGEASPASSATLVGAGAFGSGAFGDRLFMCDPDLDRIVTAEAGGALQSFASGIAGGEGLAFGPGGAWGSDLYVADADLTSLGTPADGPGRIARVAADGTVSTHVQHALLLHANALAFDTIGRHQGDLFAADIVNDRILRVTAAGAVSVFASGFNNLSGSHCIAFGPDGALYVADPGSGQPFSNTNGDHTPQVLRIALQQFVADVPTPRPAPALSFAAPVPNPSDGAVQLRFVLPVERRVALEVFDLSGRRVRTLVDEMLPAGAHVSEWDARDADGRPVANGLYLARLSSGETITRRIAIVR